MLDDINISINNKQHISHFNSQQQNHKNNDSSSNYKQYNDYNSTPINCDFTFLSQQPPLQQQTERRQYYNQNSNSNNNQDLYKEQFQLYQQSSFNIQSLENINHDNNHITSLDFALEQLKNIQAQNFKLNQSINHLQKQPHSYLFSTQNLLLSKINALRQENNKLLSLIDKSKQIGYTQITKKKSTYLSPFKSRVQQQPKNNKKDRDFDARSSISRANSSSIRMIRSVRNINNQSNEDQDSQKYQTSTYLNCKTEYIQDSIEGNQNLNNNRFPMLQELKTQDDRFRRNSLINQLHLGLQKYQIFRKQLEDLQSKKNNNKSTQQVSSSKNNCKTPSKDNKSKEQQEYQKQQLILKIQKQKKKLIKILKMLKKKQLQTLNLVQVYQKIHAQTSEKFKESVKLLQQLQNVESSEQIDEQYAQMLQLQQKLKMINKKIRQSDNQRYLQQIQNEIRQAMMREGINMNMLNINLQQSSRNNNNLMRIDRLCRIVMQFMNYDDKQNKMKLMEVQQYYQAEKQNHNNSINQLKKKQQYLAKKLLQLQRNKQ